MSTDDKKVNEHGNTTTGHSWDGIEEWNNPLPRWWLWVFYATILYSVGYIIAYPAVPLVSSATQGIFGNSPAGDTRLDVAQEIARFEAANADIKAELVAADTASPRVTAHTLLEELADDHHVPARGYREQPQGDLGARMAAAFAAAAEAGERAVIIGTDCPALAPRHIEEAFDAAEVSAPSVALGPCSDGGYYLIGAVYPPAAIFSEMPWGTDRVLALSVERARAAGVKLTLLSEELDDVDRPEDLHLLQRFNLG